jgi:hypothetical protein
VVEIFPVFGETATAAKPANGAFDDPTFGQNDEAFDLVAPADDFGDEAWHDVGQIIVEHRPAIGAVGKQLLEKRELSEQGERWLGKFGQVDKWNFCLSAARMPQIRSDYVETSTPEP